MKKTLSALLVVASALATGAAPPKVQIKAPDAIAVGHMVVASAVVDPATLPPNTLAVKYQWKLMVNGEVAAADLLVWPDGTKAIFASSDEPSVTTVILDVDLLVADAKGQAEIVQPDLALHRVLVGSVNPPEPPPPPPPPPTPEPPPGQFGLAAVAFHGLIDSGLPAKDRAAVADTLAANYAGIAAKIKAVPTYRDVAGILADTQVLNKMGLLKVQAPAAKLVALRTALGAKTYDLIYTSRAIQTADDLATAWVEVAAGLLSAKAAP